MSKTRLGSKLKHPADRNNKTTKQAIEQKKKEYLYKHKVKSGVTGIHLDPDTSNPLWSI